MHSPRLHQGSAEQLWLIGGTGEGPPLAAALLAAGWRLRVSLVGQEAARAYASHPRLRLRIGPLGSADAVAATISAARKRGQAFRWVVDASHPFAAQVSAHLSEGCRQSGQALLRLQRPPPPDHAGLAVTRLQQLAELSQLPLRGSHLLLAIGARRLAEAVAHSPGALHHARVLPRPGALRQALAAGLDQARLACLQPGLPLDWQNRGGSPFTIERALCRRWRISAVLCRCSGGATETGWRQVAADLGLRLLLLERPEEQPASETLNLAALLVKLGCPP
ncbi:MAG: precorrin-6A/cobalt-precorrin-6A reductase [Prochlorococcaceae cyanobacterium]